MHVLAHALWQQRCLEVASRLHHVGVVDETRRTYRHHGRQHGAPWRIVTFCYATLCVAPYRYAMPEPLGKPGGSRTFSADGPPQAPAALSHRSLPKCAIKFGALFNPWNVEVLVDGFTPDCVIRFRHRTTASRMGSSSSRRG